MPSLLHRSTLSSYLLKARMTDASSPRKPCLGFCRVASAGLTLSISDSLPFFSYFLSLYLFFLALFKNFIHSRSLPFSLLRVHSCMRHIPPSPLFVLLLGIGGKASNSFKASTRTPQWPVFFSPSSFQKFKYMREKQDILQR